MSKGQRPLADYVALEHLLLGDLREILEEPTVSRYREMHAGLDGDRFFSHVASACVRTACGTVSPRADSGLGNGIRNALAVTPVTIRTGNLRVHT